MRTDDKPVNDSNKPHVFEDSNSPPECSLTTPWVRTHHGLFRVNLTVVGPVPEKPEYHFSLGYGESDAALQHLTDAIMSLKEDLW
ncbi:hypothetical protein LCGC14_2283070 [marine sediment metagenome]|uniref:Uncharacterized protein n=1 Tax=marine sediment metagenome TaxID=412755 RepID=A0A0F9F5Z5_9ZZZZ